MHTKIALKTTIFLLSVTPLASSAFSFEGYQEYLLDSYRELFADVCVADTAQLSALDAELKPGAVAIEADQTEIIDQNKLVFTGNAEIERNGMLVNADRVTYDKAGDTFTGQGDIRIQDPTGNIFMAQSME